jgi:hypothetical protein
VEISRDGQVSFKKELPLIWFVEWVELIVGSFPLATKVTLKVIR